MEVALFGAFLNTLLPQLWQKTKEAGKEMAVIRIDIEFVNNELRMVEAVLQRILNNREGKAEPGIIELESEVRVFCQDTHDCINKFVNSRRKASRTEFAMKIKEFRKKVAQLQQKLNLLETKAVVVTHPSPYSYEPNLVGMDKPRDELVELAQRERLTVISIVGFGGLGKTRLAKEVYDSEFGKKFCSRARVTAAGKHVVQILKEILKEVDDAVASKHGETTLDFERLCKDLETSLTNKTYMIVIDDMQSPKQWNTIKYVFPTELESIIIVTTTIQKVATACSHNGYVYKLSTLDKNESLNLYSKEYSSGDPDCAKDILNKCDGLPIAIIAMAHILQQYQGGGPTSDRYKAVCKQVGAYLLGGEPEMEMMRVVLMNKYISLRAHNLRSCLLYFCMHKHNTGAVPGRSSLIRRWQAEGFANAKTGCEYWESLVDHNIIQPMEVSKDGSTRRGRPPGMMVEFISQISMNENFAALVCDDFDPVEAVGKIRIHRLSFQDNSASDDTKISSIDLNFVLTLAVSGSGSATILNFKEMELLVVLDLKECTNLEDKHVEDICKLLLLKYLNLGRTIGNIPREIANLKLLETLEMSTTKTVNVYREVFELPRLKHLLGNFELKNDLLKKPKFMKEPDKELHYFLEKKSRLEMITAFVSKNAKGFPDLMLHMSQLRKVKIFCTHEASKRDMEVLPRAIEKFIHRGTDMGGQSYSLSIDFAECMSAPLKFLEGAGSLSSLKLRGDWRSFQHTGPHFTQITCIKKMCLSRTYLGGNDVLAGLTNLIALEYLKLDEEVMGPMEIKSGTFRKLTRLCIVGNTSLKGITIHPGALPCLVSLYLICKALQPGLETSIGIGSVKSLKEIGLSFEVAKNIKDAWKTAAKGHPNKPQLLLIQKGAPIRQA